MSDLRQTILAADDLPREPVEVPEWDVTVHLRGLTAEQSERFARRIRDANENGGAPEHMMAELLVRMIEDPETGERVFGDDDVEALSAKSGKALSRMFRLAQPLAGLTDLEDAKKD